MTAQQKSVRNLTHSGNRRGLICWCAVLWALSFNRAAAHSERLDLFPKFQAGEVVTYRISYRLDKQADTQSTVAMAPAPGATPADVQILLRLEILGVEVQGARSTVHARTNLQILTSDTSPFAQKTDNGHGRADVEFMILPSGRIDQIKGLDALSPEQQQAWRQWTSAFAATAAFPANGIKLAQKWRSEAPEKSSSPISSLYWVRESAYLHDEPCRASQLTPQGDVAASTQAPETCAVVQTTATLKQKSPPRDTTPEDFKLHQLRTSGTASGTNKTLLYISLQTGLLIRSSDQADQTMSVTIAKSDNSNRVHYDIHAKSRTEVFRIANPLQSTP
jgi:hypothetical protein